MTGTPRRRAWPVLRAVLSVVVIVAVFGFALPRIADFRDVWSTMAAMTWIELGTLALASAWNIVTYWLVLGATLPGSTLRQNALVNQASTAVSNTLPAGGAFGVAVTYAMYASFGLGAGAGTLAILITGSWNNVVKLVAEDEVSWVQVLAAFSFGRLVTALPVTPGGLGVVELALTGALVAAAGRRRRSRPRCWSTGR